MTSPVDRTSYMPEIPRKRSSHKKQTREVKVAHKAITRETKTGLIPKAKIYKKRTSTAGIAQKTLSPNEPLPQQIVKPAATTEKTQKVPAEKMWTLNDKERKEVVDVLRKTFRFKELPETWAPKEGLPPIKELILFLRDLNLPDSREPITFLDLHNASTKGNCGKNATHIVLAAHLLKTGECKDEKEAFIQAKKRFPTSTPKSVFVTIGSLAILIFGLLAFPVIITREVLRAKKVTQITKSQQIPEEVTAVHSVSQKIFKNIPEAMEKWSKLAKTLESLSQKLHNWAQKGRNWENPMYENKENFTKWKKDSSTLEKNLKKRFSLFIPAWTKSDSTESIRQNNEFLDKWEELRFPSKFYEKGSIEKGLYENFGVLKKALSAERFEEIKGCLKRERDRLEEGKKCNLIIKEDLDHHILLLKYIEQAVGKYEKNKISPSPDAPEVSQQTLSSLSQTQLAEYRIENPEADLKEIQRLQLKRFIEDAKIEVPPSFWDYKYKHPDFKELFDWHL